MFKFFDFITGLVETLVNLFVSAVEMVLYIFGFIAQGIVYIGTCIYYLPSWVAPFVLAVTAYITIITVMNKGK